jgi:hypothetical protein
VLRFYLSVNILIPSPIKMNPLIFCIIFPILSLLRSVFVINEAEYARIKHQIVPVVIKVKPNIKNGIGPFA